MQRALQARLVLMSIQSEQTNIEHFDREAERYDEQFNLSVEIDRHRLPFLQQQCRQPLSGRLALDIGCGTGNLAYAMASEGFAQVSIGFDISFGMTRVARRKTAHLSSCQFAVGSVVAIPFADSTFDVAVGSAFLHHIVRAVDALREIYRVLKPGGVATFNEPCAEGYRFVEFLLRSIQDAGVPDPGIESYLDYLVYMRVHEGDIEALEAYPLPDKHIFSFAALRAMAAEAGFKDISFGLSMGFSPNHWQRYMAELLTAIPGQPESLKHGLSLAKRLDEIIGKTAFDAFPIHTQLFLYKD